MLLMLQATQLTMVIKSKVGPTTMDQQHMEFIQAGTSLGTNYALYAYSMLMH
jgi:hypothetical protein